MNRERIIGILLLLIGACILIVGIADFQSAADKVPLTFAGRLTVKAVWCLSIGGTVAVVGLLLVLFGIHRSNR